MEDKEIKCSCCDSNYEEEYFKYDNQLYCFGCLEDKLKEDKEIQVVEVKHYYNVDGGELGTDEEIEEVIQELCEQNDIERIPN